VSVFVSGGKFFWGEGRRKSQVGWILRGTTTLGWKGESQKPKKVNWSERQGVLFSVLFLKTRRVVSLSLVGAVEMGIRAGSRWQQGGKLDTDVDDDVEVKVELEGSWMVTWRLRLSWREVGW